MPTEPVTYLLRLFFLAESGTTRPNPSPNLKLRVMPPRTVVRCPGCARAFETEKGLRLHRAQPSNRHLPCFLQPQLGARISTWSGLGRGGRLETVDLSTVYGIGGDRAPSPDPGDDLDTPSDFDEDDLGDPAPASPALQPDQPQVLP